MLKSNKYQHVSLFGSLNVGLFVDPFPFQIKNSSDHFFVIWGVMRLCEMTRCKVKIQP